jgi:hypothetical protein
LPDDFSGGGGPDRVIAVDDQPDLIDCGPSKDDFAKIDKNVDVAVTGCETKVKVSP